MPSALLADDEDLPRAELRRMLATAWPELQVVAECGDSSSATQALAALKPDLAFVDIRMPGASGLEVVRAASGRCHVVLTTAYDSHVIEAFEAAAVDYLLKPVQTDQLQQVVARQRERLAAAAPAATLDALLERLADAVRQRQAHPPGGPERLRWISASVGDVIKLLDIDDVLFFQSDDQYTRVVTTSDEAHVRKPLEQIAEGLDPDAFWQIQGGLIVRGSAVAGAQRDEFGRVTLNLKQHAQRLPVSQAYAWRFKPR